MLKQRVLTAIVLIPLLLLAIFFLPSFWFQCISAAIFILAAWEWTKLVGVARVGWRIGYLLILLLVLWLIRNGPAGWLLLFAAISWIIICWFTFHYDSFSRLWSRYQGIQLLTGIWLLALSWYGINVIRWQELGAYKLLLLLLIVWGADTGAYFIGRKWGRHKLAPRISPGKSREGVLGGIVAAMIVAAIMALFLPYSAAWFWGVIVLAFVTALVSVLGDLFESMVKRQVGVKDSGHILPGHGGVLDRIDSLISAAPIFAGGLLLLEFLR
ncbi:MAG TPA: phosphatidate cytidylyltransferase [Gammaproteobacteria bacterium]|nr:phosphatidate cytidylyltransferase [Gammaproteobacteria bacterium]